MFKDLSAKYDQDNKERLQEKLVENKILSKKEKEKSNNTVMSNAKIYLKMKNKSSLNIEKKYYEINALLYL